jgi:hypothetical protein
MESWTNIDDVLHSHQLRCVFNYVYKVGDCLFDSISYMLKKLKTLSLLRINAMNYLRNCLLMQTPLAVCCRKLKLYLEFLHDLHYGQASTKETYLNKMLQNATNVAFGEILQQSFGYHNTYKDQYMCGAKEVLK